MSLLASVWALRNFLGGAAGFAATQVLNVCLPGGGAVVDLVGRLLDDPDVRKLAEEAADAAGKVKEARWKADVSARLAASEAELDRVAELLDALRTGAADLLARVAALEDRPAAAREAVEQALADSPAFAAAVRRLEEVARRVERHDRLIAGLVAGQEEVRPLVERALGVSAFVDECRAAGLTPTLVRDLRRQRAAAEALVAGRAADAERAFEELAGARASPAAVVGVAAAQAVGGRYVAAERSLTRALGLRPDDPELRALHARATRALTRAGTAAAGPRPGGRPPQPGDVLDGWALAGLRGRGGWGQVFRATKGGRTKALKVMHPELSRDPAFVDRFKAEIRALMRLDDHPGLVGIDDFGRCDAFGCWYFAMPYQDGPTLDEHLRAGGGLAEGTARRMFSGLAKGLAAAHRKGVVHRDVKPANVVLAAVGAGPGGGAGRRAVLVDFGLAALVGTPGESRAAGYTALFAAPETMRTGAADARSDVYALAATLYYALAYDDPAARDPHLYEPELVPEGFREVLTRSLHNNPARRPADAAGFLELLAPTPGPAAGRVGRQPPVYVSPPVSPPPAPRPPAPPQPPPPAPAPALWEDPPDEDAGGDFDLVLEEAGAPPAGGAGESGRAPTPPPAAAVPLPGAAAGLAARWFAYAVAALFLVYLGECLTTGTWFRSADLLAWAWPTVPAAAAAAVVFGWLLARVPVKPHKDVGYLARFVVGWVAMRLGLVTLSAYLVVCLFTWRWFDAADVFNWLRVSVPLVLAFSTLIAGGLYLQDDPVVNPKGQKAFDSVCEVGGLGVLVGPVAYLVCCWFTGRWFHAADMAAWATYGGAATVALAVVVGVYEYRRTPR